MTPPEGPSVSLDKDGALSLAWRFRNATKTPIEPLAERLISLEISASPGHLDCLTAGGVGGLLALANLRPITAPL